MFIASLNVLFVKCLFKSFAHFLKFVFYWFVVLYIVWIQSSLCDIHFCKYLFQNCGLSFH
jgi:hypothetical protein